jgi:hypothetical protein
MNKIECVNAYLGKYPKISFIQWSNERLGKCVKIRKRIIFLVKWVNTQMSEKIIRFLKVA